ncbi:MAG: cytosine permease, partial [Solirubrobacterales bacterium]|nr:cytosine permease [Solirubrobacterales bacterium]
MSTQAAPPPRSSRLGSTSRGGETPAESRRRFSGELETVGVAPIPDKQRTITPTRLFILWAMASASALTPIVGSQLFNFGLWWMVSAIVLAWLLAFIPAGLFSEMGREVPLTALIVARRTYGYGGAALFSLLFTVVNAGFFGLNTAVGGQLLGALAHSDPTLWTWVIGLAQTILVLFGMRVLEPFYRYTSVLFIVCYGALTVYLFSHFSITVLHSHGQLHWGPALTTILSLSILAWTYKLSTVSRFALPKPRHGGRSFAFFLAPSIGIMLSVLLLGVVGMFSMQATGNWNVALLGAHLSWWGAVAAIGVVVAIVHTNAMNLYPSTIDVLVAMNSFLRPHKWEQPVGTFLLGIASTLLAVAGILTHIQSFLNGIGDVIFPFTFIMLVDWLFVQRRDTPAEEFFERPRRLTDWIDPVAGIAFFVGL